LSVLERSLGKAEQHLCQLARRLQPVRARTVGKSAKSKEEEGDFAEEEVFRGTANPAIVLTIIMQF